MKLIQWISETAREKIFRMETKQIYVPATSIAPFLATEDMPMTEEIFVCVYIHMREAYEIPNDILVAYKCASSVEELMENYEQLPILYNRFSNMNIAYFPEDNQNGINEKLITFD